MNHFFRTVVLAAGEGWGGGKPGGFLTMNIFFPLIAYRERLGAPSQKPYGSRLRRRAWYSNVGWVRRSRNPTCHHDLHTRWVTLVPC